jgi:predicted SprT family Zn-dependent metalloprotease
MTTTTTTTTVKQAEITKEDLRKEVNKAFKYLGYPEEAQRVPEVKFNSRLKSTGARVAMWRHTKEVEFIEVNPALDIRELKGAIRHECLHVITGQGDTSAYFKQQAKVHDIPLEVKTHLQSNEGYKYQIVCKECGKKYKRYKRKGKYIKEIEAGSDRYYCIECDSNNLCVKELK